MQEPTRSLALRAALIVAALSVLAALWWFGRGGGEREAAPTAATEARTESADVELSSEAPADEPIVEVDRVAQPVRSELAAGALDSGGLLVRVRVRETREPAVGATVRWVDEWDLPPRYEDPTRLMPTGGARLVEEHGSTGTTDALGTLRIPRPRIGTGLSARLGEHSAGTHVSTRTGSELLLELERECRHEVLVVDASGAPRGGVPVALVAMNGTNRSLVRVEESDARGLVRFVTRVADHSISSGRRPAVTFGFPMRELIELPLACDAARSSPLELRLPPTGSFRAQVLEHDGRPSVRDGVLFLNQSELATNDPPVAGALRDRLMHAFVFRRGELHLPYIGLGLSLRFGIRDDPHLTGWQDFVAGPTRAGEEVVVELRRDPPAPLLRGRALAAESGEPLAHQRLRLAHSHFNAAFGRIEPVLTDADGHFRIPIPARWRDSDGETHRLKICVPHGPGAYRELEFDVSMTLETTGIALGDCALALTELPLIAAGRALESGSARPIADVQVELIASSAVQGGRDATWWPTELECVFTDEHGGFELRGEAPNARLALRATKAHHVGQDHLEISAGSRGIELLLGARGDLEGSLLLDARIQPASIAMELIPRGGQTLQDRVRTRDGTAHFAAHSLMPGIYALRLAVSSVAHSLLVIDDIEVRAGEVSRDPRLQQIDLRELVRPIALRVRDFEGNPLKSGSVHVLGPELGHERWRSVHPIQDGTAILLASAPTLDLLVSAGGHRPVRLENVSEDGELQLERGIPVVLELPDLLGQPPMRESASLELRLESDAQLDPLQRAALLSIADERSINTGNPNHRSATLVLPKPGKWRVSGSRRRMESQRETSFPLEPQGGGSHWTIEVLDESEGQRFTLRSVPGE